MKFENGNQMYKYLCDGRDLYSKSNGIYAFEYNDAHAICVYYLQEEDVVKLIEDCEEHEEDYWSAFLGWGGNILDDSDYDEYRYVAEEEKRELYLEPTLDFCNETYMIDDWMDTNDVTKEYINFSEKE